MHQFILSYLNDIDQSLEELSKKYEHRVTGLPSWVLCNRRIYIAQTPNPDFFLIKIEEDRQLEQDQIINCSINTKSELNQFIEPWSTNLNWQTLPTRNHIHRFSDVVLIQSNDFNALPTFEYKKLLVYITRDLIPVEFSTGNAKKHALDYWNNADNHFPLQDAKSFIYNLQTVFNKFEHIIKRKAFLERRVHRFINSYSKQLLPNHKRVYFEHELSLRGERRVADFILQRDDGMPALLIELENPSVKIFKNNGELTAEANHAKNQISEWIRFIDQNQENIKDDMYFLSGPKQRLVVMGKGLEYQQEMIDSKFTDTTMWTYEYLIKQAKDQWNSIIKEQCNLIGIVNPNLLI
jgi:hypothetical protein